MKQDNIIDKVFQWVICVVFIVLILTLCCDIKAYDALTTHHYNTYQVYGQYYVQRVDNYNQVLRTLKGQTVVRTRSVYSPIYPSQRPVIGKNHVRIYP